MNTASFLTVSVSGEGNSSSLLSLEELPVSSLPMDELRDLSIRWVLKQVMYPPALGKIGYYTGGEECRELMVQLDRKGLFVLKVDLVNFLNWAEQIEKRWGKRAFCELFLSSWIKMLEFLMGISETLPILMQRLLFVIFDFGWKVGTPTNWSFLTSCRGEFALDQRPDDEGYLVAPVWAGDDDKVESVSFYRMFRRQKEKCLLFRPTEIGHDEDSWMHCSAEEATQDGGASPGAWPDDVRGLRFAPSWASGRQCMDSAGQGRRRSKRLMQKRRRALSAGAEARIATSSMSSAAFGQLGRFLHRELLAGVATRSAHLCLLGRCRRVRKSRKTPTRSRTLPRSTARTEAMSLPWT